ncbi:MAG: thiaminase II [Bryobacteraceae bacterium]
MRVLFLLLAALPALAADFTESLWADIRPIYLRTLRHPFLGGLTDGSLPKERFEFYLVQDGLYLRAFGQALSVLASKAPSEEWALTLNQHAIDAIKAERELHESILTEYGVSAERMRSASMAPSNYAYTNHLFAAVHRGTFGEGLAAVLPCYWIYWEVGKELQKRGSKNPEYRRWIAQYAAPEFGEAVKQVLAMMNAEAARMGERERASARRLFVLSSRYEFLFWDMAWRREQWVR